MRQILLIWSSFARHWGSNCTSSPPTSRSKRRHLLPQVRNRLLPQGRKSVHEKTSNLRSSFARLLPEGRKKPPTSNLKKQKQPCFLCSWNRRKQLFNLAQELGCNKIALGHHQDDILHTALMNLTFQSHFATMPVRLKMRKMPLTLIRPLCLIQETDIKAWAELQGYEPQKKRCPYETSSNRTSIKAVYDQLEQLNPEVRYSLWSALETDNKLIED